MNILTFDVEDWFHILDHKSTKTEKEWINFPSRIYDNMEKVFKILDLTNTKASFFVLGWIANKYPNIVKEIKDRGYEIGSHTHLHQLVYDQNRNEFYQDVERSIKTLEDITGDKVNMFRAPGFSITEKNKWAFEVLYELGIEIDSSIFPSSRAHGGMPTFKGTEPSILKYNGVLMKEFPISSSKIFGKRTVFSGGGYFRLFPYFLIKELTKKSDYNMTYFHPRDFDIGQPVISDLSKIRKFKSYVGINGAEAKLQNWLSDFNFIDISEANNNINWNKKIIKL
jgi:polysaccharide deacetylase family protein (PEP-CTERM system associated)